MRRSRRSPRLLLPAAVAAALAPALGAGAGAAPPLDPRATRLEEEALSLAARDDGASLDRALSLLGEAERIEPRFYRARADRALVWVLGAAASREEGRQLEAGEARMRAARELQERALEELRPLVRDHSTDGAVVRALALYYGFDGQVARVARLVAQSRAGGASDPWIDLAELAARLREATPSVAIPQLTAFSAVHPELMRVRMMLARRQHELARADDTLTTLDELLAANPGHDRAKELKASILKPPPARITVLPTPPIAPPPQLGGYLPRKPPSDRGRGGPGERLRPLPVGRGQEGSRQ